MLSLAKYIKKKIELYENLVGTGFLEPPQAIQKVAQKLKDKKIEEHSSRITLIGEIVSTKGFVARDLYIFYKMWLPENGWMFEDVNEYEMYGIQRDDHVQFNKRNSVTQVSTGRVHYENNYNQTNNDISTQYINNFSFPFDFQFIAKEASSDYCRPVLLLQVNSKDDWNRHRIEGYGFVRIPDKTGYHQITVDTWRPRHSLESEIHSYFLGGSVRILRLEELIRTAYIDTNGQVDIVNRFGLETEDAGTITVNMNVSNQDMNTRRQQRINRTILKEKEKLETRKLVVKYQLQLKKQLDTQKNKKLLEDSGITYNSDDDGGLNFDEDQDDDQSQINAANTLNKQSRHL